MGLGDGYFRARANFENVNEPPKWGKTGTIGASLEPGSWYRNENTDQETCKSSMTKLIGRHERRATRNKFCANGEP